MAERRKEWGCDAPTVRPVVSIRCPACGGERRHDCRMCDVRGLWHVHRCPFVTVPPAFGNVVVAWSHWREGRMPRAGGWMDQSAWLVRAIGLIGATMRECDEEDRLREGGR